MLHKEISWRIVARYKCKSNKHFGSPLQRSANSRGYKLLNLRAKQARALQDRQRARGVQPTCHLHYPSVIITIQIPSRGEDSPRRAHSTSSFHNVRADRESLGNGACTMNRMVLVLAGSVLLSTAGWS